MACLFLGTQRLRGELTVLDWGSKFFRGEFSTSVQGWLDKPTMCPFRGPVIACRSRRMEIRRPGCVAAASAAARRRSAGRRSRRRTGLGHLPCARGRCCCSRRRWASAPAAAAPAAAVRSRATSWEVRRRCRQLP